MTQEATKKTASDPAGINKAESKEGPMDDMTKLRRWMEMQGFSEQAIEKYFSEPMEEGSSVSGNTMRISKAIGDAGSEGSEMMAKYTVMPGEIQEFLEERAGEAVEFRINSPGGSSFSAREICAMIEMHEGETTALITGQAASAGALIAQACDKVVMYEAAMAMFHSPHTFSFGRAQDFRDTADMLDKLESTAVKILSKRMDEKFVTECLEKGDKWMTAEECIKSKFADSLMEMKMDDDDDDKKKKGEMKKDDDGDEPDADKKKEERVMASVRETTRRTALFMDIR